MNRTITIPVLAAALVVAACEENSHIADVDTQASVRFVNAIAGVNTLAFTRNGNMIGSATAFGEASAQCTRLNAGSGTFAFGAANAFGTGLQGAALTSTTQNLTAGGNLTLVAAGTQTSPQFFALDNSFNGTLGSNQAAVRFVNFAPASGTAANNFDVFAGTSTTAASSRLAFGGSNATTFSTMNAGSTTFNFRNAGGTSNLDFGGTNTLNLQGGTTNTIAVLPSATGNGFRAINITGC